MDLLTAGPTVECLVMMRVEKKWTECHWAHSKVQTKVVMTAGLKLMDSLKAGRKADCLVMTMDYSRVN